MVCGLDKVAIPSFTVPMFSNKRADSHMMYCDKPFTRNAIAVAVAIAPTPTCPCCHSHTPKAVVDKVSDVFTIKQLMSKVVAKRIWA